MDSSAERSFAGTGDSNRRCGYTRRVRNFPLTLLLAFALAAPAFSQTTMPLWPGTPPGTPNVPAGQQEHDTTTSTDNLIAGKRVARIGDVATPT